MPEVLAKVVYKNLSSSSISLRCKRIFSSKASISFKASKNYSNQNKLFLTTAVY
jgi:hypothetical protein